MFQLIDDNMNKYYDERDIAQQAEQSQEVAKLNVFQKVMDSTRAAGQTQSSGGDQSSAKAPTAAPSDKASV